MLDIIKNFICFSNEGLKQFKILAGYHQYFAVNKAIESTKHASVTDGKGGVFGIPRVAVNLCRWFSMHIYYKKHWIVQLLLCLQIETTLITSFMGSLLNVKIFATGTDACRK